jgi:hypothetical protein
MYCGSFTLEALVIPLICLCIEFVWCCHGQDQMVVEFTTNYAIRAYLIISSNVMSLNPAHGEVYSIQHYVFSGYSELKKRLSYLFF